MGLPDPYRRRALPSLLARLVRALFFDRVTLLGSAALPSAGPALYLGLHRNGATDGFVYQRAAPRAVPMVSRQLTRGFLGKLVFSGIEVVRSKDTERYGMSGADNRTALETCVELLARGGELFILPEGTSDLGPSHLPFHPGAARILAAARKNGVPLRVVPMGIHYERGRALRTRVTIVVGEAFTLDLLEGIGEAEWVAALQDRIEQALLGVGINVADAAAQARLEQTGYVAAMDNPTGYFPALKAFESGLPETVTAAWKAVDEYCRGRRVARHHGVPVAPVGPSLFPVVGGMVFGPLAVLAALANLPPLLVGALAARRLADAANVITFWRILAGTPAVLLYWTGLTAWLALTDRWAWIGAFAVLTAAGIALWRPAWQLGAMSFNTLFRPGLVSRFRRLHTAVGEALGHG